VLRKEGTAVINDKAAMIELTLQHQTCTQVKRWKPHIAMQLKNDSAVSINTNTTVLWITTDLPLYNSIFYHLQTFCGGNLNTGMLYRHIFIYV
jgi:hypothetical protein